ncbi:MAG: RNA-binding domain-containing protein [Promethearchaeota archaeon]
MSKQVKLISIDVRTHCHATENISLVKRAICRIVPIVIDEFDDHVEPLVVEGDYGNKITVIHLSFRKMNEMMEILRMLKEYIPDSHKMMLKDDFNSFCSDGKNLFLRIHKQMLLSGRAFLSLASDIIHIKMKFGIWGKSGMELNNRSSIIKEYLSDAGLF